MSENVEFKDLAKWLRTVSQARMPESAAGGASGPGRNNFLVKLYFEGKTLDRLVRLAAS